MDIALPSTVTSSEADLFGVFEMPYLVKDRAHMKRIDNALLWKAFAPAAQAKGLKILAVWENGYRYITNSSRPNHTPEDPKGIKPMKFSEVFTALQTGFMDGQENPFTRI